MPILYTVAYIVVLFICGYGIGNHKGVNVTDLLSLLLLTISGIAYGLYILTIYPGFIAFWIFMLLTAFLINAGTSFGSKSQLTEAK